MSPLARRLRRAALLALLPAFACAQDGQPQRLDAIELVAGATTISAEVARSERERELGLMHRASLGADEGMLFVFGDPQHQCFWMRNTLIPLAAAFISDDGRIVNVAEMQPRSEDSHCAARPVRFVLEMNAGWFARHGLGPGDLVTGEPFTR